MVYKEYIICYDIEKNKIRNKVFKRLEAYGLKNIQKSVFWGFLQDAEVRSIYRFLKEVLEPKDKAVIIQNKIDVKKTLGYDKDYFDFPNSYEII